MRPCITANGPAIALPLAPSRPPLMLSHQGCPDHNELSQQLNQFAAKPALCLLFPQCSV